MSEPSAACPYCGKVNDDYMSVSNEPIVPKAGDASICLYCAHANVFTGEGLATRKPTAAETAEFDANPQMRAAMAAVRMVRRQRAAESN